MRGVNVPQQRINLLPQDAEGDSATPLQPASFGLVGGLGLLLLIGSYLVFGLQIGNLEAERDKVAIEVANYLQQLGSLQTRLPPSDPDPVLVSELQRLQASQVQIDQAIRLIEQQRQTGAAGFAELLRGLARHPVEGMWLQDIGMAHANAEFVLRGKTIDAALVPRLLRLLGSEAAFSGRTFREVTFERPAGPGNEPLIFELRSRRGDEDAG